jgi:hypothetical protein
LDVEPIALITANFVNIVPSNRFLDTITANSRDRLLGKGDTVMCLRFRSAKKAEEAHKAARSSFHWRLDHNRLNQELVFIGFVSTRSN